MKVSLSGFNKILQEEYVQPMNEFFRDQYRKLFNEEPPEDNKEMMDRLTRHGESQVEDIIKLIGR